MKNALFLLYACSMLTVRAEIFFGSATSTNKAAIGTNEAIVVSAAIGLFDENDLPGGPTAELLDGNKTNYLRFSPGAINDRNYPPVIIVGPAEFRLRPDDTNQTAMISFRRLHSTSLKTEVVPQGTNVVITIATNQFVHFFAPIGNVGPAEVNSPNGSAKLHIRGGSEFEGPATIRIFGGFVDVGQSQVGAVTYFVGQDSLSFPDLGALRGPTGLFELVVEKSTDLVSWTPVIGHVATDSRPNFYRFRFSR